MKLARYSGPAGLSNRWSVEACAGFWPSGIMVKACILGAVGGDWTLRWSWATRCCCWASKASWVSMAAFHRGCAILLRFSISDWCHVRSRMWSVCCSCVTFCATAWGNVDRSPLLGWFCMTSLARNSWSCCKGIGLLMHVDWHEGIGGCNNGVGNDTEVEPEDAAVQAGALDVIFGVGGAKAAGCAGSGRAGHVGGWSNVGASTAAGDTEAIDGALLVAPATCSLGCGTESTNDDPGVVKLVMLAAAEDEAEVDGLIWAGSLEWSLKCSGTWPLRRVVSNVWLSSGGKSLAFELDQSLLTHFSLALASACCSWKGFRMLDQNAGTLT